MMRVSTPEDQEAASSSPEADALGEMEADKAPGGYGATDLLPAAGDVLPLDEEAARTTFATAAPYTAEFTGTFIMVFTYCCASIANEDPLWRTTGIGCMLAVLVYGLYPISGANLNPAVTLSLFLCGKLEKKRVIGYMVVQVLAGWIAAMLCNVIFGTNAAEHTKLKPENGFTWLEAGGVELIYTTMLCLVVSNCLYSKRNNPPDDQNQFFGIAIGFAHIAAGYAARAVSGISLNPAISLGIDCASFSTKILWGAVYAGFECLGALLAATLYPILRLEDYMSHTPAELASYEPMQVARLTSEFVGTFLLTLTVGLNIVTKSPSLAWSVGAALTCLVYSLGNVSGGHFNPAVTLAAVLSRRGKWCGTGDGVMYATVQVGAGVCAGLITAWVHRVGPYKNESLLVIGPVDFETARQTWPRVFEVEFMFTFMLGFVVMACFNTTARPGLSRQILYFGLAIGACVVAGGCAVGEVSGGLLNPAVAFMLAVGSFMSPGDHLVSYFGFGHGYNPPLANCLWYSLFQLGGGLFATLWFFLMYPREYHKEFGLVPP